jgi:hypothetical protein
MAVSTPVTCPIPGVRSATWLDSFAASTSSGVIQPSSAMNAAGASMHGSARTNGVQGGARCEPVLLIGHTRRNDRIVIGSDRGANGNVYECGPSCWAR